MMRCGTVFPRVSRALPSSRGLCSSRLGTATPRGVFKRDSRGELCLAAVAFALLTFGPSARAASFGDDNRRPVPASRQSLADSIGLVATGDGKHACTAVCLSPSLIATAAHCLVPPEADAPARQLTFRVGPPAARRIARVALPSDGASPAVGSRTLRLKAPINATDDWGIAGLEKPACGTHGLPLSTRTREQIFDAGLDGRVIVAGFHRDRSLESLTIEQGCAVDGSFPDRGGDAAAIARDFADETNLLLHRCDTGLGSSGAPLLLDSVAGPEIAGLNIGTYFIARFTQPHDGQAKRIGTDPIANTAVAARVVLAALDRIGEHELLSTGPEITSLQQKLSDRRIYTGDIDGKPSLALRVAIITYERMHAMPSTGLATKALLARIAAEPADTPVADRPTASPLSTGSTR
jgi:hypothetical protein